MVQSAVKTGFIKGRGWREHSTYGVFRVRQGRLCQ